MFFLLNDLIVCISLMYAAAAAAGTTQFSRWGI